MNIGQALRSTAAVAVIGVTVGGCATPSNSNAVYSGGQVQREQIVRMGTLESIRPVTIQHQDSGVGTLGGVGVGGLAGSAIGGGRGSIIGAIVGAVAGGIAGNAIENNADRRPGYELTVRLDDGEMRAIVQAADEPFQPGDRVRILSRGGISRVTH
ncbi:MAG: glycine zipper 2TM domain-containing protein [Burkholderiaceae bacterium]